MGRVQGFAPIVVIVPLVLTVLVLLSPTRTHCNCISMQSIGLLVDPGYFVVLMTAWFGSVLFLSFKKGWGLFSILLFALVFFGFYLFRFPFRTEELFTYQIATQITQTAHFSNLWESSWPELFGLVSIMGITTGLGANLASEFIRLFTPLAASIVLVVFVRELWPTFTTVAVFASLIGSYGLSDIFQLTPVYFSILTVFFFSFVLVKWMKSASRQNSALLVIALVAAILSHPFASIYVATISLASTMYVARNVSRRRHRFSVLASILVFATAYNIFYVQNFGGFLFSGLMEAASFLQSFRLGSADATYISSHVALQPVWSVYVIYFWAALTLGGFITSAILAFHSKRPHWFVFLMGSGLGVLVIQFVQSSGSGIVLAILTFISPIAIVCIMSQILTFPKSKAAQRVPAFVFALLLILLVTPSFLTYNSQVYTQSYRSPDLASVNYLEGTGTASNVKQIYGNFPGLVTGGAPIISGPLNDQGGLNGYARAFLGAQNSILYLSYDRFVLGEEFVGVNQTTLVGFISLVGNANEIYSSGNVFVFFHQ